MKYLLLTILALFSADLYSQNLVPDPGFENWNGTSGFYMAPLFDWNTAANTPDHHHQSNPIGNNLTSADPSQPLLNNGNTGHGAVYAGLGCLGAYKANGSGGNSEWASTLLTSPLEKDSCYKVSFYIQNKKNQTAFPMATSNWGVYFGNSATTAAPQSITYGASGPNWASYPQVIDGILWQYIELHIVPDFAYTYLNIGYVGDWLNGSMIQWSTSGSVGFYVWIDEVSVEKVSGCCPTVITSVTHTDETCSQNNGTVIVNTNGAPATFTLINVMTGATVATNTTGLFTGLDVGKYFVTVDDGICSQPTAVQEIMDVGTPPNAGIDGAVTVCATGGVTNLFNALGGSPNAGGTWSPALSSGTGAFNPSVDLGGVYTYNATNICWTASATVTVTITTTPDATITEAGPFCTGSPAVTLSAATAGGNWFGNGITSSPAGTFDPSLAPVGSHIITYLIPGSCSASDTVLLTILPIDDASFSYSTTNYCNTGNSVLPAVTGDPGGTFTMVPSGTIGGATGEVDLATSGAGTYTIYYTTNGACPDIDSATIQISTQTSVNVTPAGPFCIDAGTQPIVADIPGGTWTGTDVNGTSGVFNPAAAGVGTWQIIYTVPGLCGDADTIQIVVNGLPNADAGIDQMIYEDSTTVISATGGQTYVWTPGNDLGCDSCATTSATPTVATTFTVMVTDINGCVSSDQMLISLLKNIIPGALYIPNAFTPDGDEHNNNFRVTGESIKKFHMEIYDRWGNKVFETEDYTSHWDGTYGGKPCPQGVYTYTIRYAHDFDTDEILTNTGHVNILR
ncbi:gliding motility-associated C-terminal domain-containing protein [Crocinitomicaceae bacterium]|jgi:gliding motility-associated-like protein|nr:gliding motility-associated C-terminal domain-containing protein [Crocinitomicaceae bacterium]